MYIVGFGGSVHDFSCCLMKGNEIVAAIEEERLTREKHAVDKGILENAILNNQTWKIIKAIPKDMLERSLKYCLDAANITEEEVDLFITTDSNTHLNIMNRLSDKLVINHHVAHMASAFYPSTFSEAAILVVDGKGSFVSKEDEDGEETITLGYGLGNKIKTIDKTLNHSIGHFYESVTLGIGFNLLEAGKTMGLSSYGTPVYLETMEKWFTFDDKGGIEFTVTEKEIREEVKKMIDEDETNETFQTKANIASSAQVALENMMIHICNYLYKVTNSDNLCIAGGVGLNSVANGKLLKETGFKNIYIQPAAGDNGLAIGTAMYGAFNLRNYSRV